MKSITFLYTGQAKNPHYKALEQDYHQKVQRYLQSDIFYLKDSPEKDVKVKKRKESDAISKFLKPSDVVVLCDERGKSFDSLKFSSQLEKWQIMGQRVVLIVGGAFGVSDELREQVQFKLKLSDFVMPHELARVVLLEQVYRGLSLLNGEKYHH